jgi:hypothetical protein
MARDRALVKSAVRIVRGIIFVAPLQLRKGYVLSGRESDDGVPMIYRWSAGIGAGTRS